MIATNTEKPTRISIMGCGWLGLPLAIRLRQKGYSVKGSTTSKDKLAHLEEEGISAYQLSLAPNPKNGFSDFFETDIALINIPPSNPNGKENYPDQLKAIIAAITDAKVKKVLFVSTTSVYPNLNRVVREDEAEHVISPHSGVDMLAMEQLFTSNPAFETTVLRFAGLFGGDRKPGRFLAGKKNIKGAQAPVNLIHLEDCIGILHTLMDQGHWGSTFNACSEKHPSREDFYTLSAKIAGLEPPTFSEEEMSYKIITPDKLAKVTGYRFFYPDPLKTIRFIE